MSNMKNPLSEMSSRITPEFASVLEFCSQNQNIVNSTLHHKINIAKPDAIKRINAYDRESIEQCLIHEQGCPAIITDAVNKWPAKSKWTFQSLLATCTPRHVVYVNDRAPARHADSYPGNGGVQRTIPITFGDFIRYIESSPSSVSDLEGKSRISTPFYLNGWRAFVEFPELLDDISLLFVEQHIDNTIDILKEIDAKLFSSHRNNTTNNTVSINEWYHSINANLTKLFIGPPGTVTRLHYDAGEAHGWLAQIKGRKLFVLFPPSETEFLQPLASEKETIQSAFDPLHHAALGKQDESSITHDNKRALSCIVDEGEAILIPKGWWHYAVALDRSITVQRNFYHAASNGSGLVHLVKSFLNSKQPPPKN